MLQDFNTSFIEIKKIIDSNKNFLIITHDFPDGDCLGAQITLFELLNNLGKKVSMACRGEIPYQYNFLPNVDLIKSELDKVDIDFSNGDCVCFCLDSADEDRFDFKKEELDSMIKMIINIDHHLGNTQYGDINIVDPKRSAAAEIIYEFIVSQYPDQMNYNMALGIYTGIITDTGRFQYENTTANVHRIISNLLGYGIVASDIFSYIYENEPYNRFKLLKKILNRIRVVESRQFIYSYVLQKDFKQLGLPFSANDGLIELLRSASSGKIAALFKQVGRKKYKVSLRSADRSYDVAAIASKFGGGGHKMASAFSYNGTIKELLRDLVKEIEVKGKDG